MIWWWFTKVMWIICMLFINLNLCIVKHIHTFGWKFTQKKINIVKNTPVFILAVVGILFEIVLIVKLMIVSWRRKLPMVLFIEKNMYYYQCEWWDIHLMMERHRVWFYVYIYPVLPIKSTGPYWKRIEK